MGGAPGGDLRLETISKRLSRHDEANTQQYIVLIVVYTAVVPGKGRFKRAKFCQKNSKVLDTWNLYAGVPPNNWNEVGPEIFDW